MESKIREEIPTDNNSSDPEAVDIAEDLGSGESGGEESPEAQKVNIDDENSIPDLRRSKSRESAQSREIGSSKQRPCDKSKILAGAYHSRGKNREMMISSDQRLNETSSFQQIVLEEMPPSTFAESRERTTQPALDTNLLDPAGDTSFGYTQFSPIKEVTEGPSAISSAPNKELHAAQKGSGYTNKLVQLKEARSKITPNRTHGAAKKAQGTQAISSNEIFQSYSAAKIDSKQLQRDLRRSTQKLQTTTQVADDYADGSNPGALLIQQAINTGSEPVGIGLLSATNSSLNNRSSAFEATQVQRAPDRAQTQTEELDAQKVLRATKSSVINVHQHFNQPNIVNFNNGKVSKKRVLDGRKATERVIPKVTSGSRGVEASGKQIVSVQKRGISATRNNANNNTKVQSHAVTQIENLSLSAPQAPPRRNFVRTLKSAYPMKPTLAAQKFKTRNRSAVRTGPGSQENLLPARGDLEAPQFNMQHSAFNEDAFRPRSSVAGKKLSNSQSKKNVFATNISKEQLIFTPTCNYGQLSALAARTSTFSRKGTFARKSAEKKRYPAKEDIYDDMIAMKGEINDLSSENVKHKTKIANYKIQLKNKDKFIGQLLESTYKLSLAVEKGGSTRSGQVMGMGELKGSGKGGSELQKFMFQNYIDKGPHNIIKIKQQNQDLQDLLDAAKAEIIDLHRTLKATKVTDLNDQITGLHIECQKLRLVGEQCIILLMQNGLQSEVQQNKRLRAFSRQINWDNYSNIDMAGRSSSATLQQCVESQNHTNQRLALEISRLQSDQGEQAGYVEKLARDLQLSESKLQKEKQINVNFQRYFEEKNTELAALTQKIEELQQPETRLNSPVEAEEKPKPEELDHIRELEEKLAQECQKHESSRELVSKLESQIQALKEEKEALANSLATKTDKYIKLVTELDQVQKGLIRSNQEYIALQQDVKQLQQENQQKGFQIDDLTRKNKKMSENSVSQAQSNDRLSENLKANIEKLNQQVSISQSSNNYLVEEINRIHERLINVNFEDVDERSDLISRVSHVLERQTSLGSTKSKFKSPGLRKSPTILSRRHTSKVQEIIHEETNDDLEGTTKYKDEPIAEVSNLQKDIKETQIQERRKSHMLGGLQRSQTQFERTKGGDQDDVQSPDLLGRLGKQIEGDDTTNTIVTDMQSVSQKRMSMSRPEALGQTMLVQRSDPVIQRALLRLGRLQQIKRLNLDQIEIELFGREVKVHKKVTIADLTQILCEKLLLPDFQAQRLARFLVEEQTEKEEGKETEEFIEFNPKKKINLQLVIGRLMAISSCPTIYQEDREQATREKFISVFSAKREELFEQITQAQLGKRVTFILFQNIVWGLVGKDAITSEDLDCAYILLCRQIPVSEKVRYDDIAGMMEVQVKQTFDGFHFSNIIEFFSEDGKSNEDSDSEELNQVQRVIKIQGIEPHPRAVSVGRQDFIDLKGQHTQRTAEGSANDSPGAPVTPVLGGFGTRFPSSLENSSRKLEPPTGKQSFPYMEKQEFSFVEKNDGTEVSEGFKTDSSYIENDSKKKSEIKGSIENHQEAMVVIQNNSIAQSNSGKNNSQDTLENVSRGERYSDSRSETDFDMQASMVHGFDQLKAFKAQRDSNELEKSIMSGYSSKDLEIIRRQGDKLSSSKPSELLTPTKINFHNSNESSSLNGRKHMNPAILANTDSDSEKMMKSFTEENQKERLQKPKLDPDNNHNRRRTSNLADRKLSPNQKYVSFAEYNVNPLIKMGTNRSVSPELVKKQTSSFVPVFNQTRNLKNSEVSKVISQIYARKNQSEALVKNTISPIQKIGQSIIEKKQSIRQIFKNEFFILIQDGEEMEVIQPQEFMAKIDEIVCDPEMFTFLEKTNILALFENPVVAGMVLYQDVSHVLQSLGIEEGRPENTQNMNFDKLDTKSIRILNRLKNYLTKNTIQNLTEFTKEIQNEGNVDIEKFFQLIQKCKIRNDPDPYENLKNAFIKVDTLLNQIKIKDLDNAFQDYKKYKYFRLFGESKQNDKNNKKHVETIESSGTTFKSDTAEIL